MRRTLVSVGLVMGLVACGAPSPNKEVDLKSVRSDSNLRKEVVIEEFNFPKIQSQLFKHREACPINFEFSLDKGQVHYATVIYGNANQPDLTQQAVLDLTFFSNGKMQITGYTYYSQQQYLVNAFLQAIAKPEVCPNDVFKKE